MPPTKNASLLQALASDADALACNTSQNQFPVLLRPLAERRRVTAVEFRPLLVDAVLTAHRAGFRILFNSDGSNAESLNRLYESENRLSVMPARLRFSLAHELAHTLFYDLAEAPPAVSKKFRSGGGKTVLENLERNCNVLASHLLLPTPMLKSEVERLNDVTPDTLLALAQRAGVSIEVLVRRLGTASSFLVSRYFRGCVVLLRRSTDGTIVRAVARPKHLNIARDLLLLRPGELWQLKYSDGSQIRPEALAPISSISLCIETQHTSSQQHHQVRSLKIGECGETQSYLLTFEEGD